MMNNLDEIKFEEGKRHQAGMTVPEGFFATFQANLEKELDKIEPQKTSIAPKAAETPSIAPKRIGMMRWVSVAACAIVLVCVGLFTIDFGAGDSNLQSGEEQLAEAASEEYSETDQLIISSFDDLYLYDLYCETTY